MNGSENVMNTNRRHHSNGHECIISTCKTIVELTRKKTKNFPQRFHKYYLRFNPLFSLSNRLKSKIMDEVGKFFSLSMVFFSLHLFGWQICLPFIIQNSERNEIFYKNFTINLAKFQLKKKVIAHRFVNFNIKFTCFVHVSPEICLNRKTKMCQISQIPI